MIFHTQADRPDTGYTGYWWANDAQRKHAHAATRELRQVVQRWREQEERLEENRRGRGRICGSHHRSFEDSPAQRSWGGESFHAIRAPALCRLTRNYRSPCDTIAAMYPTRRAALAAAALALIALAQTDGLPGEPRVPRAAPEQPLPFSHRQHAGVNATPCKTCHTMPDPGDFATVPKTAVCMGCHAAIKKDSPHIAKLTALHAEEKRVPWVPVYRVPDWVSFNHNKHVAVEGVTCETCHGPVATRDVLRRERDISMTACMDCHRAKRASNQCIVCHDQR